MHYFCSFVRSLFNPDTHSLFSIGKLAQLQFLNLSRNELKTIPSSVLGALVQLKKLDLAGMWLQTALHYSTLFQSKFTLSVIIVDNKLVALPYNIHKLSMLKSLRLHCNRLTVLPRELMHLSSLKALSICNVSISGISEWMLLLLLLLVTDTSLLQTAATCKSSRRLTK